MTNNLTAIFSTVLLLAATATTTAQPERYLPGLDYAVIDNPVPDRTPDKVEVTEFFWYGCPGCFAFEPQLADWIEKQNDDVLCLRLPAIWDDWREVHARAFYTASSLGVLEDLHPVIFDVMHRKGNRLRNEEELRQLFGEHGVSETDFTRVYHSFTVSSEINRAKTLASSLGVRSTPSMIVNGKYIVTLSHQTLDIVDFLVQKELM